MSLTRDGLYWHQKYEELDDAARATIDSAYRACRKELELAGPVANDDRAEELVAAITRYYHESGRR